MKIVCKETKLEYFLDWLYLSANYLASFDFGQVI
jgi:hypothetical protein